MLRLLRHLPRYSRYWVALHDDDELAVRRARHEQPAAAHPPLAGWDEFDELRAVIREELAALRYAVVATTPGLKQQPRPPKPVRRPLTAQDRQERREDQRKHDLIVKQVLPPRG
ncbi:hypothetical protein JOF41_007379 [Saccharothrix coeruleofusca]|uniref:hypothetical protein n=1 Tax=Saccharothrix coeruleofusca TaxID=33919 RepID=UPI001AE8F8BB|nr:hypothetical protein [Saccharothrix coeruleofusca]MBP2341125.1 hypothetical protein [Saccharothrix coeruleofusca]